MPAGIGGAKAHCIFPLAKAMPLRFTRIMAKPNFIELNRQDRIPILYEDRSVMALDKPPGWMLVPISWQKTQRNLQAALMSSMMAGSFWARSRQLKFLRYIHRLDAETSGILLFAKSQGALKSFEDLFETRQMHKVYLAVTDQAPKQPEWNCRLCLGPDPRKIGRVVVDPRGKTAETDFRLVAQAGANYLIEARPYSGRTHQIRVHLAEGGCPILGDELYGRPHPTGMALRAVALSYTNPFTRKRVSIRAPVEEFLVKYGFEKEGWKAE